MPIYMKIDDIPGNVSEEHHKDWMTISSTSIKFDAASIEAVAESGPNVPPELKLEQAKFKKPTDAATTGLMEWMTAGGYVPKVTVDICRENGWSILRYILSEVAIEEYKVDVDNEGAEVDFKLRFNKLQIELTPYDQQNKPGPPTIATVKRDNRS